MNYEIKLAPDAASQIEEYLAQTFVASAARNQGRAAIFAELLKLEGNPGLGYPHYGNPFEGRLTYRFLIQTSGQVLDLQVLYMVLKKEDRKSVV